VADLVDVVRTLTSDSENRVPHLAFQPQSISDIPVLAIDEVETAYYLRLNAEDKPGVLADIARILANQGISIEALIQKEAPAGASHLPIIMITHRVLERELNAALAQIEALDTIQGPAVRIRLETLK
jgi:homoserine dehydrogenase